MLNIIFLYIVPVGADKERFNKTITTLIVWNLHIKNQVTGSGYYCLYLCILYTEDKQTELLYCFRCVDILALTRTELVLLLPQCLTFNPAQRVGSH